MSKSLVIVESPTKAKTIQNILGKDYKVISTMGHIIDLPKSKVGIDIENNFKPSYVILKGRSAIIKEIKKESKKAKNIYLATDPDREGEAIGWHIKERLPVDKECFRVILHEITPLAIKEAFTHHEALDMNKVSAQQGRRILDRLVGYFLSPLLWKKISRGLSAGRVQSVALRLIVEREREIENFKPEEYWQIEAKLKKQNLESSFIARLNKINNQEVKINAQNETTNIINDLKTKVFKIADINEKEKRRFAPAPFITSTLQQEGFNKLKFITKKTMFIAQQLYEGIDLGAGETVGLITYMRTDSFKVAPSFIESVREHIANSFGKDFVPESPNVFKVKKSAQEAHEAIRPSGLERSPEKIKKFLTPDQYKLYELIYNRSVASQMKPAVFLSKSVVISADNYEFSASGTKALFDGFLKVYKVSEEDEAGSENTLPDFSVGETLDLLELIPSQHFTKAPGRYSESSLVKALEEDGVGRPSTYAPIIQTIVMRNYVNRQKGYFFATQLGMKVSDLLVDNFAKIMDIKFTAALEDELDEVEEGKLDYVKVLQDFYVPFKESLEYAKIHVQKEVITTDEHCPLCNSVLIVKWGRRGQFLSCSKFPECKFSKSITTGIKCPAEGCTGELIERRSRRGAFYGCSKFPNCKYITDKLSEEPVKDEEPNKINP